jgi:hypothetical protein
MTFGETKGGGREDQQERKEKGVGRFGGHEREKVKR